MRYKETHFLGMRDGCELWGIVDEGLPYCYWQMHASHRRWNRAHPKARLTYEAGGQQVTAIRVDDSKWLGVPWLINDRKAKMPWTTFVGLFGSTVSSSNPGIAVSNVTVVNSTTITATLTIAANAAWNERCNSEYVSWNQVTRRPLPSVRDD